MSMDIRSWLAHHHAAQSRLQRRSRRKVWIRPVRPSRANELWYKAELLQLVHYISKVTTQELLPLLKTEAFFPSQHDGSIVTGDAFRRDNRKARTARRIAIGRERRNPTRPLPAEVSQKIDQLAQRFGNVTATAKRLSRLAITKNLASVDASLIENVRKAIGINIRPIIESAPIHDALRAAEQANLDLITSIPKQYMEKVKYKLEQNYATGERWEDLADALEDAGDVTASRAKLIARDQTSKMNGAFNRVRQTSIGIAKYRWQTAGDERVRPTHHDNDGKVFRWDSPPSETGNPGDDINCRCVPIPEFDLDDEE